MVGEWSSGFEVVKSDVEICYSSGDSTQVISESAEFIQKGFEADESDGQSLMESLSIMMKCRKTRRDLKPKPGTLPSSEVGGSGTVKDTCQWR